MKKDEKSKNLLLYVLNRLEGRANKTKLSKLIYLIDLDSKTLRGRKITPYSYDYYYFGPFSKGIVDSIDEMREEGSIITDSIRSKETEGYNVYIDNNWEDVAQIIKIDKDEKRIADSVIEKFGSKDFNQLMEYVYNTEPIRGSKQGELGIL